MHLTVLTVREIGPFGEVVWEFARTVFTSLWGIANVSVLLWFGSVWIRRWGTLLVAAMLVL